MVTHVNKSTKKPFFNRQVRQNIMGWTFVLPAVLLFALFIFLPIIIAMVTSFSDFNGINKYAPWGFNNYAEIFKTDIFLFKKSLMNLGLYIVMYVPLNIIISLGLAMLVSGKARSNKWFRLAFYLPSLTSGIAVATVWSWMLNPQIGLINTMLRGIGLSGVNWINDPKITMITVTIVSLWGGTAANTVLYVAAIQGINESLIEAAKIEGAKPLRIAVKIIIPMVKPITYFVMTTVFIGAFQLYDQALMMFGGGGPQNSALTPIMAIQNAVNRGLYYGKASAMSTILLVFVLVFTNIFQRINKERYD